MSAAHFTLPLMLVVAGPLAQAAGDDAASINATARPAAATVLEQAIRERRLVLFRYQGHERVVEPHACGISSSGEPVLHGYQTEGGSASGNLPGWRTYALNRVEDLRLAEKTFAGPRPGHDAGRPKLDPVWAELAADAK